MAEDGQAAVAPAVVAEREGAGAPGSPPGALPGAAAASPASPALISVNGESTGARAVAVVLNNDAEWPELPGALRAAAPPSPLAPTDCAVAGRSSPRPVWRRAAGLPIPIVQPHLHWHKGAADALQGCPQQGRPRLS